MTDLLAFVQDRPRDMEAAWRDLYHAWTFPYTVTDGSAVVAGYVLCEEGPDAEQTRCKVDEICVGLMARKDDARFSALELEVQTEADTTVTITVADLAAVLDAVKVAE